MKVKKLIELLQGEDLEANVGVIGDGYQTDAGTWLEGDWEEVAYISKVPQGILIEQ